MGKCKVFPSVEEFCSIASVNCVIPVYREVLADMETPVSAFKKLSTAAPAFLLESVEGSEKWGRYSFIGIEPRTVLKSKGNNIEIIENSRVTSKKGDPLDVLKDILKGFAPVEAAGLPRFYGGAVGYIGYDMVRFFERLPDISKRDTDLYDAIFLITGLLIIFDNLEQKIKVVYNAVVDRSPNAVYEKAVKKIDEIVTRLKSPVPIDNGLKSKVSSLKSQDVSSNFSKEGFLNAVEKAKEYIQAGDAIQVVLSQRFNTKLDVDPFDIYRCLRIVNPSPYMFYMKFPDIELIGSSPEILVRVEGKEIDVRPIAGTRRRGRTINEDKELEHELLSDPKEIAEHIMLVDLGRNDVGRVCRTGTVNVNEFMTVEKYSHVMHIVSNAHGKLKDDKDSFDALRACFPAGTLTGAPKVRAMEIIEELEPCKRGAYGGSVGYFGFSGNMDMAITIRTLVIKGDNIYIQAGAGIVADSVPENEYQETINKAKAMLKAVEMAREGLE